MANKKRRCTGCKDYFPADKEGGIDMGPNFFHNQRCAWTHWNNLKEKSRKKALAVEGKQHREAKKRIKDNDRPFQLQKTQTIFNRYVRLRDIHDPCISCLRFHDGQYHAGHYRTVGANPELRFDERNCHKQCSACNNYLSGNIVNYRINLINKISLESVRIIEGPHEPKRYTLSNLKTIQRWYKRKTKRLERDND